MANDSKTDAKQNTLVTTDAELSEVALDLFKTARNYANGSPEQLARRCFQDASVFLSVKAKILSGEIDVFAVDKNPLDYAFAPNLKKTHPINLVAREYAVKANGGVEGAVKRIQEHVKWLEARPTAVEYEDMHWDMPQVNTARALFPQIAQRAEELATSN